MLRRIIHLKGKYKTNQMEVYGFLIVGPRENLPSFPDSILCACILFYS